MIQWGMRQSAEMENLMTSVERVLDYGKILSEADLATPESKQKEITEWPHSGKIVFRDVWLKYGMDQDGGEDSYVLKGLNFETVEAEKVRIGWNCQAAHVIVHGCNIVLQIGVVGRTGAGKSSMIAALFRIVEPKGDILIDGITTRDLGLHDLRRNMSIIPQDPLLFTGTFRKNLDPFGEYGDKDIWQALEQVKSS